MKTSIIISVLVSALAVSFNAAAQSYSNLRFGLVGGLTSASSKVKDVDTKSVSLYHAGAALEIPLGAGFAIQPEILYQVKGLSLDKWEDSTGKEISDSFESKVGYVEVPVQIQWGPDLLIFRPYAFLEPFVGYQITDSHDGDEAKTLSSELKKVEYGLSLGAGIDIRHLQISAKYFWNFGDVYDSDIKDTGTTIKGLKDGSNFNGIAISLAYFF